MYFKGKYSDSDSDPDEELNDDMDALRRVFLLTGTTPNDLPTTDIPDGATTSTIATASTSSDGINVTASISSDSEDDDEDDLELVRNLHKRFSNSDDPLSLNSLSSLPLVESGDDLELEDDLNTLRAIQRRFSAYNDGGIEETEENPLHKPVQVGINTKIASEKEVSNNLFVERNNDVEEGFHDCVDTDNIAPQTHGEDNFLDTESSRNADTVPELPLKTSNLPKQALAFIDAIKKNRECQKIMRSKMMHIEARMGEIKRLSERVKILKDFQFGCRKRTSQALSQKKDARVQLISTAKQRPSTSKANDKKTPALYYGPPENPQAAAYEEALKRFPISVNREKWTKKESENLAKGVKQQFQEMLLQQSMNLLDDEDEETCDLDTMMDSIKNREMTAEDLKLFLPMINWEQVSSMYVTGRSGTECQTRWMNWENPLINRGPWTTNEEKMLLHIIQEKGMSNWIEIAESLNTNRTAFQCLAHYQRSLNASIIRREWSKDEDDKLISAVEEYGESNWQVAASVMEGRTGTQCSNRWKKTLHPRRKRIGKWSSEEDKQLEVAVKLFGTKWWKIANFIPGRMQSQCRERWVNVLDPCLKNDTWSEEEDLLLSEAIKEIGYSWSMVAARVPHRTDNQCRRRWMVLFPDEVPLLREAKRMQKAALMSNFVDREKRRPDVGPNDFLVSPALDQLPEPEHVNPSVKKKKKIFRKRQKDIEEGTSSCNPGEGVKGKGARGRKRKVVKDGTTVKSRRKTKVVKNKREANVKRKSDTRECQSSIEMDDGREIKYVYVRKRRRIQDDGENEEEEEECGNIYRKVYKNRRSKFRNNMVEECSPSSSKCAESDLTQIQCTTRENYGRQNRRKRKVNKDEASLRVCKTKKRRCDGNNVEAENTRIEASKELEIVDNDDDDGMTLADFCKKFKDRKGVNI